MKKQGEISVLSLRTAQNMYSGRLGTAQKPSKTKGFREVVFFDSEEVERFFRAVEDPRDRALFSLVYHHGLRASEPGKLTLGDYQEKEKRIHIHRVKGSTSGVYPLIDDELRLLRAYLRSRPRDTFARTDNRDAIFLSRNGRPISRRRLDELMKHYCELAGIAAAKAHMHVWKHTCATSLLSEGWDIRRVQDWIGHADIRNTVMYTHVTNAARIEMGRGAFRGGKRT